MAEKKNWETDEKHCGKANFLMGSNFIKYSRHRRL
jgi:hypothetical protein